MIEVKQIYWAAGLLDGEGCFAFDNTPIVMCSQRAPELMRRYKSIHWR